MRDKVNELICCSQHHTSGKCISKNLEIQFQLNATYHLASQAAWPNIAVYNKNIKYLWKHLWFMNIHDIQGLCLKGVRVSLGHPNIITPMWWIKTILYVSVPI